MTTITTTLQESFHRSFALYSDLVEGIHESDLALSLPQLPSNSLGLQLWCVVGARESFSKAIEANEWSGFACSLHSPEKKESVVDALKRSAEVVSLALETIDAYTEIQNRLIVDLLEHEASHHGQLIRYIYGLNLPIPDSWKSKYALQEITPR